MFYIQKGQGECLVFLHGWGADHRCFTPLIDHFSQEFCVTAVDFAGFGKTPAPDRAFTIQDYCDILKNTLHSIGVQKARFVCHSFGGRVGILLAAQNPDMVEGLVLIDSAGVLPKRGWKYRCKVRWYKIKKFLARAGLYSKKRLQKSGSADFRALSGTMRQTFVNIVNRDLTDCLPQICCPTLLIWGENDRDTPLYMAEKMKELIPDSGLVVIEGAGHFSFLDNHGKVKLILQSFFGR